ncbi:ATP-binding protein [Motilibacter peucedani]|uniref:ATP-binding protein n=1 Tax=Motilibacter peucedani TaxID=598650 RepID=UPI001E3710A3|nr:ATP-binding protein [Motilibacter peucedani]
MSGTAASPAPGQQGSPVLPVVRGQGPVAGVARGLADHLGISVRVVRVAFVVLALCGGAGVAAYALFWWFAPVDPAAPAPARARRGWRAVLAVASVIVLLVLGAHVAGGLGIDAGGPSLWPVSVVIAGVAIVWWQADETQRARWWATAQDRRNGRARNAAGVLLVVVGAVALVGTRGGLAVTGRALLSTTVLVVGIGLVTAPYWLRMARDLSAERAARVREQERAEVAAHLHDSVLHTLTLIQRRVDDPREVARLARAQERELRAWLYRPETETAASFAPELGRTVAEVEDTLGVPVELVTVGDAPLDDGLRALLRAAREATLNAAKHGAGSPVTVFAEVEGERAEVFVRDRGPGFELAAVPTDRLGVRQSILGRMERHGGRATIRSTRGEGTEVALEMPVGTPSTAGDGA